MLVQQFDRLADVVAPTRVPELHRDGVLAEDLQQPSEVRAGLRRVLEARRKLREQRTKLAGGCQRLEPGFELIDVGAVDSRERVELLGRGRQVAQAARLVHAGVRELLIQLERELESRRRSLRPAAACIGTWGAVEAGVHLHGVEVLGVVRELVEPGHRRLAALPQGIEQAVPRALARRVAPAGRADAKFTHSRHAAEPCSTGIPTDAALHAAAV